MLFVEVCIVSVDMDTAEGSGEGGAIREYANGCNNSASSCTIKFALNAEMNVLDLGLWMLAETRQ